MQTREKPALQLQIDKAAAKTYYGRAFWTSAAPALILLSLMCGAIGRSGGDLVAWFTQQWLINSLWLMCVLGLLCFAAVEIAQGLRRASKYAHITPTYTTRVVGAPGPDGSYTTELIKDGIPYGQVDVGSISVLIAQNK